GESVRLTNFHASPVCAPTRSSVMTGRWNYRTGVVDTYVGRAMMRPDELTLPEILAQHGYCTGIFGKWHLGDNYPLRPIDQGFQESLVHNGGGIAQPSDPEFYEREDTYFNPVLQRNGVPLKYRGYCTDIFIDAAMDFIEAHRDAPWFAYVATNAPHVPLQVPAHYVQPYRDLGLNEDLAQVYGMIANLDENIGRLLDRLDALDQHNTIVIFMTDNGAARVGGDDHFNAGMRGWKGTVYEGGLRVPCFWRHPGGRNAGVDVTTLAAHVDLMPSILTCCNIPLPEDRTIDGISLWPLLGGARIKMPPRKIYFQWHRGDVPEPFRNSAVLDGTWKLVDGKELYNLIEDPAEANDIAGAHPEVVAELRAAYDAWYQDVSQAGYEPPRIVIGGKERPTVLTRQDWRGTDGWGDEHLGHWEVSLAEAGAYDVLLEFKPLESDGVARFRLGAVSLDQTVPSGSRQCLFRNAQLEKGDAALHAEIEAEGKSTGCRFVTL
ncbi:MAG: arylsulfatase, partial [Candidatus Hydrogenedentes bacterium]|nr:arylsulfatase [Candidatus Hydrogenedentota bacterium]